MYINKKDYTGESARMGQTAEDLFENWLKEHQRKYRKATLSEQYKHIDFIINSEKLNKDIKIDVKASKKVNRNDTSTNNDILWVEFKNVQGKNGWLYGEK